MKVRTNINGVFLASTIMLGTVILIGLFFLYGPIFHRIPSYRLFFSSIHSFPELKMRVPLDSNSGISPGFITSLVALGPFHSGVNRVRFYLGDQESFKFDFLIQNLNGGLKSFSLTAFLNYQQTPLLVKKKNENSWKKAVSIRDSIGKNEKYIYNMEVVDRITKSGDLVIVLEEEGELSIPRKKDQLYIMRPKHISVFQIIKGKHEFTQSISKPFEFQRVECNEKFTRYFLKNKFTIIENCADDDISGVLFGPDLKDPIFYKTLSGHYSVFKLLPNDFTGHIYNVSFPYKPRENWMGSPASFQRGFFGW